MACEEALDFDPRTVERTQIHFLSKRTFSLIWQSWYLIAGNVSYRISSNNSRPSINRLPGIIPTPLLSSSFPFITSLSSWTARWSSKTDQRRFKLWKLINIPWTIAPAIIRGNTVCLNLRHRRVVMRHGGVRARLPAAVRKVGPRSKRNNT